MSARNRYPGLCSFCGASVAPSCGEILKEEKPPPPFQVTTYHLRCDPCRAKRVNTIRASGNTPHALRSSAKKTKPKHKNK